MATTDLVTDYGGVGNGQYQTVTGSITSGASPVLTPATPIFSAGDVGRAIVVIGSGFIYPTSGPVITIASYNGGTGAVTLTGSNSTAKTSVTLDIIWGTDNTTAFMAYRTWAQGLGSSQAHLTIPAGHFCANLGPFTPLNLGVQNALITGPSGAPATCTISSVYSSEMRLGGDVPLVQNRGLTHASATMARLNSTTAGALTATLVDKTGYGSRITVGADCLVHGYDMQSVGSGTFGYPPNPYFYEWNKIIAYDSGTGTVTFLTPLKYAYMSDWPIWATGSTVTDQGGPATVYVLTDYDRTVEIQDVTLLSIGAQIACHGKNVILRNVRHTYYGVYPTMNATYAAYSTTFPINHEIDKIIGTALFEDCTIDHLQVQSASPDVLTITRGSVVHLTGTPKSLVMDGTDMTGNFPLDGNRQIQIGNGFGRTNSVSLSNITNLDNFQQGGISNTGIHGGGFSATFPMTNGIFTFLKSENDGVGGYQNPGCNLVPGTWIALDSKKYIQITRVWEDGTYVYHQTTETGGWPLTFTTATAHSCPDFTMRNCSGLAPEIEDYNLATARIPLWSYSRRTYTADGTATTPKAIPFLIGRLTTAKFTVTNAASVTFLSSQSSNRTTYKSDYTTYTFGPTIACVNAGLRTVNGATTATGAQGSDSLPDLTSIGHIWFRGSSNSGPAFSANSSGAIVVVEYQLDTGLPAISSPQSARVRLRIR